jgi:hypothetical protein
LSEAETAAAGDELPVLIRSRSVRFQGLFLIGSSLVVASAPVADFNRLLIFEAKKPFAFALQKLRCN